MAEHVCPAWLGWWLASPFRKLLQDPEKILGPYIREGMTVLEPGSAMGFFSLPAARMVGAKGKVICVDLQAKMIEGLRKRAAKAGLLDRLETRVCTSDSLKVEDLKGKVDFAFAIAVAHEVPDPNRFFREIAATLKPGAKVLFAEPKGHVSAEQFATSVSHIQAHGMKLAQQGIAHRGLVAVLEKK